MHRLVKAIHEVNPVRSATLVRTGSGKTGGKKEDVLKLTLTRPVDSMMISGLVRKKITVAREGRTSHQLRMGKTGFNTTVSGAQYFVKLDGRDTVPILQKLSLRRFFRKHQIPFTASGNRRIVLRAA